MLLFTVIKMLLGRADAIFSRLMLLLTVIKMLMGRADAIFSRPTMLFTVIKMLLGCADHPVIISGSTVLLMDPLREEHEAIYMTSLDDLDAEERRAVRHTLCPLLHELADHSLTGWCGHCAACSLRHMLTGWCGHCAACSLRHMLWLTTP